jgi:uncharacterized protein (TIGR02996 family)
MRTVQQVQDYQTKCLAFIGALADDPTDMATWMAYTDWLRENGQDALEEGEVFEGLQRRGLVYDIRPVYMKQPVLYLWPQWASTRKAAISIASLVAKYSGWPMIIRRHYRDGHLEEVMEVDRVMV